MKGLRRRPEEGGEGVEEGGQEAGGEAPSSSCSIFREHRTIGEALSMSSLSFFLLSGVCSNCMSSSSKRRLKILWPY
jgi:hypothetical protein